VAVLDLRQLRIRKPLVDEQADLLDIVGAELFAQGLAHRMRSGLGNRDEDETMLVGDDHAALS
jgi:hypothetical protein